MIRELWPHFYFDELELLYFCGARYSRTKYDVRVYFLTRQRFSQTLKPTRLPAKGAARFEITLEPSVQQHSTNNAKHQWYTTRTKMRRRTAWRPRLHGGLLRRRVELTTGLTKQLLPARTRRFAKRPCKRARCVSVTSACQTCSVWTRGRRLVRVYTG